MKLEEEIWILSSRLPFKFKPLILVTALYDHDLASAILSSLHWQTQSRTPGTAMRLTGAPPRLGTLQTGPGLCLGTVQQGPGVSLPVPISLTLYKKHDVYHPLAKSSSIIHPCCPKCCFLLSFTNDHHPYPDNNLLNSQWFISYLIISLN